MGYIFTISYSKGGRKVTVTTIVSESSYLSAYNMLLRKMHDMSICDFVMDDVTVIRYDRS